MGKINLRTVFVIGFCCIPLWAIFFMIGIRTIGAFLFPIILCVVCWGASVLYEKLVDKAGEKKKVAVTMIALLFLGALSVWLFSGLPSSFRNWRPLSDHSRNAPELSSACRYKERMCIRLYVRT